MYEQKVSTIVKWMKGIQHFQKRAMTLKQEVISHIFFFKGLK